MVAIVDDDASMRTSTRGLLGALGFLVKGAEPQQIREAVREVAAGQAFLPATIVAKLAEAIAIAASRGLVPMG